MKEQINNILQDLYNIDPTLKSMEKELTKIIKELLASRPDTKFDNNFRLELRTKLLQKAEELLALRSSKSEGGREQKLNKFNFDFMKINKLYYFAGAVVVIILLIVPTIYYFNNSGKSDMSFGLKIAKLDNNAFGALSSQSTKEGSMALGIGAGGGGGGYAPEMAVDSARAGVPAPYRINYNFIYQGDELGETPGTMAVLKRIKKMSGASLGQFLNKINFKAVNLSKFSDSNLQHASFVQDKDFGYYININLEDGSINISENHNKWPNPSSKCRDQKCYEESRLNISDVPDDETLIAIAGKFISEYGIDTSMYGQPEINQNWKEAYERAVSQKNIYIPETLSVVYPLIIDNKDVYDQGGYKQGLNVNINLRHKKASGIYNFTSQNYQSSDYSTETNNEEIIKMAENGGISYIYTHPEATKTVNVNLGTPTMSYVKIWNYNEGASEELIIPAYIFPITSSSEDTNFWQKNIIVPLVKDLIESRFPGPILLEQGR